MWRWKIAIVFSSSFAKFSNNLCANTANAIVNGDRENAMQPVSIWRKSVLTAKIVSVRNDKWSKLYNAKRSTTNVEMNEWKRDTKLCVYFQFFFIFLFLLLWFVHCAPNQSNHEFFWNRFLEFLFCALCTFCGQFEIFYRLFASTSCGPEMVSVNILCTYAFEDQMKTNNSAFEIYPTQCLLLWNRRSFA